MIISNQGRCKLCGDAPFSAHRHDFKSCECGEICVDGGTAYLRRLAKNFNNFIEMSIAIDDNAFKDITARLDEELEADILDAGNLTLLTMTMLEEYDIRPIVTPTVDMHAVRHAAREGVFWATGTGRNGFGVLSALMRYVRDAGSGWEGSGMRHE